VRVLFLDLDGVLNAGHGPLDPACVARLNRITDATGAVIVVSSMWRWSVHLYALIEALEDAGVTGEIRDVVPTCVAWISVYEGWRERDDRLTSPDQGEAIRLWLSDNPKVVAYVVLDDQPIDTGNTVRTVTDGALGLTDEHVARAIAILGGAA